MKMEVNWMWMRSAGADRWCASCADGQHNAASKHLCQRDKSAQLSRRINATTRDGEWKERIGVSSSSATYGTLTIHTSVWAVSGPRIKRRQCSVCDYGHVRCRFCTYSYVQKHVLLFLLLACLKRKLYNTPLLSALDHYVSTVVWFICAGLHITLASVLHT